METCHGEVFSEAVRAVMERGGRQIVAVGVNCTNPEYVEVSPEFSGQGVKFRIVNSVLLL